MFFSTLSHFVSWSRKLKVHRANLQMILSYPVRFSTDTVHKNDIFLSFSPLVFFFFSLVYFYFCLCVCVCFFLNKKKYILIHLGLCGRVVDKKIWPGRFVETILLFILSLNIIFILYLLEILLYGFAIIIPRLRTTHSSHRNF